MKCIDCKGAYNTKDKSSPFYIKEHKVQELKSQNHVTTSEARRAFQVSNNKYAEIVEIVPTTNKFQETIKAKF